MADEVEVLEVNDPGALTILRDAEVDLQISTARKYPRSVTSFMRRGQELATLSPEIAAACIYAVPRDGRTIEGPSARFAEIMLHAWGNARAEGKVVGNDAEFVTSRGVCWDLETNTAIGYEVRRRITNRNGQTYNADMITVTGNAGSSIALRNAILKNIPTPFWKPIYNRCRQVVAGDAKTFASRRDDMLHEFAVMGVTEARLCAAMSLKGKADMTLEHMATLAGFYTALKDGDTTIEEAFPDTGGLGTPQPAQRKSQQPNGDGHAAPASPPSTVSATEPKAPASGQPSTPASGPANPNVFVGVLTELDAKGSAHVATLLTDTKETKRFAIKAADVLEDAQLAKSAGAQVTVTLKPSADPAKYLPTATDVRS